MLDQKDFKVIIVGGGVAGLALANMLEQYGWDYLILESHSAIAPQVGASIGMFPNGLRILDQLGLYDPIHDHFEGQTRCETFYTRRADGTVISQLNDVRTHLERSFGIAKNVPGWVDGTQHTIVGQGISQLVVSGPENKVYWFLFERLSRPNYGKDITPYSREDEAEFVRLHYTLPVTENITFGQIYEAKSTSTLTPLHEVVYKKWFYKRIITIGDSAHKPNPVGGQGANGAIESCAELINAIVRMKDGRGGDLKGLTTEEVVQVSHEMQTARHERAELIVSSSHQRQALFAFEKPLQSRLIIDWISPVFGSEPLLNRIASNYLGATIIKTLPVPRRERSIPFNDELQSTPVPNKASATGRRIMIGFMALALLVTSTAWRVDLDEPQGLGPKNVTRPFDNVVAVPTPSALGIEAVSRLSIIYPWTQYVSPLLIYTVEGYRIGNQATPLAMPLLFSAAIGLVGINLAAPLHAILSAICSNERPSGRAVPLEVARSLVPALTLGYILPSILAIIPLLGVKRVDLLRFAPCLFSVLTSLFTSGLRSWQWHSCSTTKDRSRPDMDRYTKRDLQTLKSTYSFAFGIQATAHLITLGVTCYSSSALVNRTLLRSTNLFIPDNSWPNIGDDFDLLHKYDLMAGLAAVFASKIYSIWDLRRLGYIKTLEAIQVVVGVVAGQILVGPGATWAGLWYWRESVIATQSV
ncbi:FAD binding domain-containing protein [Verticillium alfalfae VaMs.102]|uniref:Amine oxidase n=1 Tax=Verticillium alfalfae (strain VaMs.102 / ATCC MYA-4576 / FGSC 10136) TaxID=526221 RepID=C9SWF4_VERA1|nr:FAD binding domain-containing protein [Verticillium alfalfae VaMs.102]EEY23119.1 FAD binding domain-containing protein [Verticillium alfalfae VaMs.102]